MKPNFCKFSLLLVIILILARWATYQDDFPPISGSLGEYMDMGVSLESIRSFTLEGKWDLDSNSRLYFSPIFNMLSLASLKAFGHNFFAYRFLSLFFGSLAIVSLGVLAGRAYNLKTGLIGALLLASDAVWFAYSRCEKQEVTAAVFLFMSALVFGLKTESRIKKGLLAGGLAGLAVFAKLNLVIPAAGMFFFVLLSDKDYRSGKFLAGVAIGGAAASGVAALLLLHPLLTEAKLDHIEQFKGVIGYYQPSGNSVPFWKAAIHNLIGSNIYLRSPALIFGFGLALLSLSRIKKCGVLPAALSGIILANVLAPALFRYFPLRYRILPVPEAALLLSIYLYGFPRDVIPRAVHGVIKGLCNFLLFGFLFVRFGVPQPELCAIGWGVFVGFATSRLPDRFRILSDRKAALVIVIVAAVGLGQIGFWMADRQSDIYDIAEDLRKTLPSGTPVATNSWWGKMVLMGTEFPEVEIDDESARAYLLTKEPDDSWSIDEKPDIDISGLTVIYEKRAWFNATYLVYERKPPSQ